MAAGTDNAQQASTTLVHGLRVLRERWWVVVVVALLCMVVSLSLSLSAQKQYSATASILVGASSGADLTALINPNAQQGFDPEREQATSLTLVTSPTVALRVKQALKLPDDASSLESQVSASAEPNANLISVSATDADPDRAARIANGFADQYVAYRKDTEQKSLGQGEVFLQQQIDQLPPEATAQRAELAQTLRQVRTLRVISTGNASVAVRASAPGSPSSPRTKRNAILALLIGIVLGLCLIFIADLLDRRLKDVDAFESLYGLRALATIPERGHDPLDEADSPGALEPFRILRNALGFLSLGGDIRVVLITSAVPSEGKSTAALGLAKAAAASGQRVYLVEADLRRSTFRRRFGMAEDSTGLSTAIIGMGDARDLAQAPLPDVPTLSVLPAGPTPPDSAALLRSDEMTELLRDLSANADLVVVDAPPLLPVADAQVLLDNPAIDAVLVVGRAYHATRDQVRRARTVLDQHRLASLGLVVNGVHGAETAYDYRPVEGRRHAPRSRTRA